MRVDAIPSTTRYTYRPELDGLRALAVVAVIINHFEASALQSGHLGVDVFFVISGFVISSSLYWRRDPSFLVLLSDFYVRRLKRLLPALIACVVITSIVICLFDQNPGVSLRTGLASLFGISNLYLFRQATDYFGASAQLNVFTHTWSLGVEEQFYVFFPLIVWITGLTRTRALVTFSVTIALLSVVSLAFAVLLPYQRAAAAFYLMPARFWELGVGCLSFAFAQSGANRLSFLRSRASPLALMLALCIVFAAPAEFSPTAIIVAVALTAALILSLRPDTLGYRVLSHPTIVYVGQISYSLYLWHWSVVSLSRWTVGIHWWSIPFQAALMFSLAGISYRWLERPLRSAKWAPTAFRTIAFGAAASLCAALLLAVLGKLLKENLYAGRPAQMIAKGGQTLLDQYRVPNDRSLWLGDACVLSDNAQVGKLIPIDGCTLGNFDDARRRVLVVGNSFSAAFVRAFDDLVSNEHFAVTITSSWGASPVPNIPNKTEWDKANDYYWTQIIPRLVSRLSPGDALFLINDLSEFSPQVRSHKSDERLETLAIGLEQLSDSLRARNISLFVLHEGPFLRDANCDPDLAVRQWFTPFGGACKYYSRAESLARRAPLDAMLVSLSDRAKINLVDLFDVFCPTSKCTYEANNGQFLYRDRFSHPSVEAAQLAAPLIQRALLNSLRD